MSLLTNLVSYWKLDESSGDAADAHGSNTLTNNNTVAFAPGKLNNGADFEATQSESLSVADASQTGLDFSTALTFSLWFKLESQPGVQGNFITKSTQPGQEGYFWGYRTSGTDNIRLFVGSDGAGNGDVLQVDTSLSDATWYHLAVTWDGSTKTAKFYIDGSQFGSDQVGTVTSSIFNASSPFVLGAFPDAGLYTDGIMDEVGVWSRALSAAEIAELYNSGTPLAYEDFAPATTNQKNMLLLGVG